MLKYVLGVFFVVQVAFSQTSRDLFGVENIYPLYGWKIFHTEPTKYLTRHTLFITSINGVPLARPTDFFVIHNRFPNINSYTFSNKIVSIGWEFETNQKREGLDYLHSLLMQGHSSITWELRRSEFDPIEYFQSGHTISSTVLTEYRNDK